VRRLLLLLVLVPALAGCTIGGGTARPSGVAERWLQAIGDSGRDAVRDDALRRASDHGSLDAADRLVDHPAGFEGGSSLFTDLEVGAATVTGAEARVPFRLTLRLEDGRREQVFATAVLRRAGDEWRVTDLDDPDAGELVPSRGGARPASATTRHWAAAVAFGALAAVASALVIEAQPAVRTIAGPGYVAAAPQRPLTEENQQWRSTSS
jgi:hypothetical protein